MFPALCNDRERCHEQARYWLLLALGAQEPEAPCAFLAACGSSPREACFAIAQAWLHRLDWLSVNQKPKQLPLF